VDLSVPASARTVTDLERFAIAGVKPRLAWRPESADELADAVRQANAEELRVVPWGGGVALTREAAPARYDVALDTTALSRITIYDPEDFTVSAQCGIRIHDLRAALAEKHQELPLEAAESWAATLGGVLAANASGPRRRMFGSPRDRILGAHFVTGDGVLAKTGGRVVKNVAGHAVHRLLVGSHGTLAVFTEASLKLMPHPMGRIAWHWGADAATLADAQRWSAWPRREPAVLTVIGRALAAKHPVLAGDPAQADAAPFTVVAGFEEDPAWLEACDAFARDTLGTPRGTVRDTSVPALWQQLTDFEEMPGPRLTFTSAHATPDAIAFLAGRPVAERLLFHAPCGRLHLWPEAEAAAELVRELAARGFACIGARGFGGPGGAPGDAGTSRLRSRIRAALDPSGVFALGAAQDR
jgi:FAD/FMN-containing dehydrogenase